MSKVTALKKVNSDSKAAVNEQIKNSRIPNVEIPASIMQEVQKLVKDKGTSMAQFWKEAAGLRLQTEDIQSAKAELDRLIGQIAYAENKLREIEEREQLLNERELRIEEVELSQSALNEERLSEIEKKSGELEEVYQAKLAEVEEVIKRQEEEHRERLGKIETEVRERSEEYRRYLDVDYQEKERELIKREARIEIREQIALEKEKFWSTMYDSVVKLTRVCGAMK